MKTSLAVPVVHPDPEYIAFDPYLDCDRDVDIRHRTVRILTVRKPQLCFGRGQLHTINPGERARFEKAVVDGEWGSFYICLACMDQIMREAESRAK